MSRNQVQEAGAVKAGSRRLSVCTMCVAEPLFDRFLRIVLPYTFNKLRGISKAY